MQEETVGMRSEKPLSLARQVVGVVLILVAVVLGYSVMRGEKEPRDTNKMQDLLGQTARDFSRASRIAVEKVVDPASETPKREAPPPPTEEEIALIKFETLQMMPALKGNANQFDAQGYLEKLRNDAEARKVPVVVAPRSPDSAVVETAHTNVLHNNWNRLLAGTNISGIVMQPIDTTLPGAFTVQVQEDVFSAVGMQLLIPRGSKIQGEYGTSVRRSQHRVLARVNRLIVRRPGKPDAIVEVDVDSQAGDVMGRTGIPGKLETFFWERMANATLYALIGAGASLAEGDRSGGYGASSRENYKSDVTEAMADVAQDEVRDEEKNYKSVIRVAAGARVMISLTKDIVFDELPGKAPEDERY